VSIPRTWWWSDSWSFYRRSCKYNPIAANNEIAADSSGDICSKSLQACTLRNNQLHFGGFPGTGRTTPKRIKCILPWIHQYGDLSGQYGLCCFTLNHMVIFLVKDYLLLEAFNSKKTLNLQDLNAFKTC
jgi:hypothetical protein